ncbi:hypothetical protein Kpol_1028p80 [Vanderwaltozyma polyspora DSM 70294]|uniref:Cystathionine gamma-synthase n=1 Tax=Vanderwaltozyma polyspora (strain ATCC 22028 / DSM 70294 / BCRC 21397 / CBS 2163 / NBRC 10782 / NRRL Y-8283 / UCD 57-17) TaxID=436907 RepID=A7TG47_VANPO|nr:uncharacterized protein Kpol_1028p80 [Vanderwaltozyma polyspora DSM 70294]EDO18804.1 hypothetical protein Kpol_1028p80 [Vanderwaltozyma polyspora DSM 70294]
MIASKVGQSIPPNTSHAISVCLPTWEDNIAYSKGDSDLLSRLQTGYPRFNIHKSVQRLCEVLTDKYAKENESCLCFPSYKVAKRCREYIRIKSSREALRVPKVRILQLATSKPVTIEEARWKKECRIAVVFVDKKYYKFIQQYWQYTGEIISSRLAEYVLHELFIVEKSSQSMKSPNKGSTHLEQRDKEEYIETRYGRNLNFAFGNRAKGLIKRRIATKVADNIELEAEDFENYHLDSHLNLNNHQNPTLDINTDFLDTMNDDDHHPRSHDIISTIPPEPIEMDTPNDNLSSINSFVSVSNDINENNRPNMRIDAEKDVFLFPSGMASLFTAHRLLLNLDARRVQRSRSSSNVATNTNNGLADNSINTGASIGYGPPYKKTVLFGFSNNDTKNILSEFNHTHYFACGDSNSLKDLECTLHSGEQILAVFVETPSNPLLKMPDLAHLRRLANLYGFYIIIDETMGGFVNIDVLPYADIVCSSLTKIFSGSSNVIAGSMVLNPQEKLYSFAQVFMSQLGEYEDHLWCEDAIYLERNSRDFIARTIKTNQNTEFLLKKVLLAQEGPSKLFKKIFYPSLTSAESKVNYDAVRCKSIDKDSDEEGGYGGLFSLAFNKIEQAKIFFNELNLSKGPSLGTNFTLSCPYTVLMYYDKLDEVAKYEVEESLVRVSIGIESQDELQKAFQHAIDEALNV